eukprot:8887156-Pyramimonas_sp.AAC.2
MVAATTRVHTLVVGQVLPLAVRQGPLEIPDGGSSEAIRVFSITSQAPSLLDTWSRKRPFQFCVDVVWLRYQVVLKRDVAGTVQPAHEVIQRLDWRTGLLLMAVHDVAPLAVHREAQRVSVADVAGVDVVKVPEQVFEHPE